MKKITTLISMLAICSYASTQGMKDRNKNKKDTVKPKTTSYYTCVMTRQCTRC